MSGKHKYVYKEPHLSFDKNVISLPNRSYLKGYWQSEKYFENNKLNILNDLRL